MGAESPRVGGEVAVAAVDCFRIVSALAAVKARPKQATRKRATALPRGLQAGDHRIIDGGRRTKC